MSRDKFGKLAAMMDRVVKDDPHEAEAEKKLTQKPPVKQPAEEATSSKRTGQGRGVQSKAIADQGSRERTAVNLTPPAIAALKRIQAFLITECGATSVSASAAMCIALETTGDLLRSNKKELADLYQEIKKSDRRRTTT